MGAEMSDQILEALRVWYGRVRLAGVVLPEGLLGSPGDLLRLSRAEVWGSRLLVELDERVLLSITRPSEYEELAGKFIIRGFAQLVVDRETIGTLRPRAQVFRDGALEFWGQGRAALVSAARP